MGLVSTTGARSFLVLAVMLSAALAGCSGSDKSGPGIKSVPSTESAVAKSDFGSVDGTTYDSEIVPIKGVAIILFGATGAGEDLRGTSDENGHFAFNDLQPGTHRILADLSGYTSQTQNIVITAGEVTKVKFVLDKVVVRVYHPNLVKEENGTIKGPVVVFMGPNGREDTFVKFPVDEWPRTLFANLTWPCGTACVGAPESNYLNLEIDDSEGAIMKRCTDQVSAPNNMFFLSCKLDSFAKAGEYKIDVFAWEGHDVNWNLKIGVNY